MLLHTADWHLGKVLEGVSLLEDQRDWLARFCSDAERYAPDLILMAGDVFDYAGKTPDAKALFDEVMSRLLAGCGCPIAVIPGNHDDISWLKDCFAPYLHRGVTLVTDRWRRLSFTVDSYPVSVYAIPYHADGTMPPQMWMERVIAEISLHFDTASDGKRFRVAMAHGLILPQGNEAVERILAANRDSGAALVDSALFAPFDYTALGHIHANLSAEYRCWYAGSPLVYAEKEIGQPKGYQLVRFTADGIVSTAVGLPPARPVMRLRGYFDELERGERLPKGAKNAYLYLDLLDSMPKPNGFARMKDVFPHLLRMRYADPDVPNLSWTPGLAGELAVFLRRCGIRLTEKEFAVLRRLEPEQRQ